jgi:hypothetical protein
MPEHFKKQDPLLGTHGTDWHFLYIENADLYVCEREKIEQAYISAPSGAAKGYVYGIYESRQRTAIMTGNGF